MLLSDFNCPSSSSVTTIKDSSWSMKRRKYQPIVKDLVEDSVLEFESPCFLLRGSAKYNTRDRIDAYIVDRTEIYTIVDRILLEFSAQTGDSFQIGRIQLCRSRLRMPRQER
jgi:hypothetical protein